MVKASHVLGMNAREKLYSPLSSAKAKSYAYSKMATKKLLEKHEVPTPKSYAVFESMEEVRDFDWDTIESSFVIKPVGGSGGKGILVIKRPSPEKGKWIGVDGRVYTTEDLELHISDILEGQFSTWGTKHRAFLEERVPIHPKLKHYVYKGTPDVRVIVYNSVPVMAMLRLPTKESEGRANLHQGAIGVGIDIASGVTTQGIWHGQTITSMPNSKKKRKLNGIRIPKWTSLLKTAVRAANAAGLEYAGVDLFAHPIKGAMVVELNSSPGLSIQLANSAGLRKRLERVGGLKIRDAEHGVRVGRALFTEWFTDAVKAEDGAVVVDSFEWVDVRGKGKQWKTVKAKLDTGAFRSSIDRELAKELGLLEPDNFLWEGQFRSALGREKRPVVEIVLKIKGKKIRTSASVADRTRTSMKMLIGRRDLQGFLINPVSVRANA